MSLQNITDLFQTLGIVVLTLWVASIRGRLTDAGRSNRGYARVDWEVLPRVYVDPDTGRRFLVASSSTVRRSGSTILRTIDGETAYWLDELPTRTVSISNFRIPGEEDGHEDLQ